MSTQTTLDDGKPTITSKLRILCLHGFRQNASGLKGRTKAFCHKLRDVADWVFVDAPHLLPFYLKMIPGQAEDAGQGTSPLNTLQLPQARKRAWMLSPELMQLQQAGLRDAWEPAPEFVDELQYRSQTEGWAESRDMLCQAITAQGPFDGVMGFSQGAAAATLLCAQQQHEQQQQGHSCFQFRFAILASGYPPPSCSHGALLQQLGPITLPSLHIFGGDQGSDRQIGACDSVDLMNMYHPGVRSCIQHGCAHLIPSSTQHVNAVRDFLTPFTAHTFPGTP